MKKILIIIIVAVITAVAVFTGKYIEYSKQKTQITKINNEFLAYQKSIVKINKIVTLMNRAIDLNNKNKIEKDENGFYKENNTNSIKVYLKVKSSDSKMEMEKLMLDDKAGVEKVEYAFSDLIFEMTDVEYHQKTGQVKSITFEEKETKNYISFWYFLNKE